MKRLKNIFFPALGVVFCFTAGTLHAQHYPAGSEGIQCASMPPPGLYVFDYNSVYYSDRTPGYSGQLERTFEPNGQFKPGFSYLSYTQAPRLLWMFHFKPLDADYGMAIRVPIVYKSHDQAVPTQLGYFGGIPTGLNINSVNKIGLGDIQVEPLILAWHLKRFDIVAGYSFWAPTGDYDHRELFLLNLGEGDWTHMLTLGGTWFLDAKKSWAISMLNRYEINQAEYSDLYYVPVSPSHPRGAGALNSTPGNIFTMELAASKTIAEGVEIGVTGYYQKQTTAAQGPTWFGPTFLDERVHVAGAGPEIKFESAKWGLSGLLRYDYEFSAMDHPQGSLVTVTLTKSF
jgi:hypothetical protein